MGLIIVLGSIFLYFEQLLVEKSNNKIIKIGETSITVEIADTFKARAQGLSGREVLPESTGMLFIFDQPAQYGFWMKDMNFAIDIVWIDEKMRIIGIEKVILPNTFPQVFYPNQAIKYVLELPAGFSDEHRIDIGQYVTI